MVDPQKMQKLYPSVKSAREVETSQKVPKADKDLSSRIVLGLFGGLITLICFALSCMSVFFYDKDGNYVGGISFLSVGIVSLIVTILVVCCWDFVEKVWNDLFSRER